MANGDAPPPDVPHFDTRFMVQTPDGSTATQVLRTDRPISTDELTAHLAQQGSTFLGYPDAPQAAAPSAAPTTAPLTLTASDAPPLPSDVGAPSPAPAPTAAPGDQTWAGRAAGTFAPDRSFKSQLPSIGLAAVGSGVGGAVGGMTGPAAPLAVPALRIVGGGLGGAGGEALTIGGEKLLGLEPAEAGSAANRIINAGVRSAGFEAATAPIQYAVNVVRGAAQPITEAAAGLKAVLTGEAATGAKTVLAADGSVRNVNLALSSVDNLTKHAWTPEAQQTLLGTWWQRQAGQAPEKIAAAWDGLGDAGQQALAGDLRGHMQTVVDTIQSGLPIPDVKRLLLGGGGLGGVAAGHPMAIATAIPAAKQAVEETVPWLGGKLLRSVPGSSFLAALPRIGEAVAPRMTLPLVGEVPVPYVAAVGQGVTAHRWPRAAAIDWTGGG